MENNKPFGIIYKATCKVNGKSYIGKTIDFQKRLWKYKSDIELKRHPNIIIHNAIRKYGWDNFTWETLMECNSIEELNLMEISFIMEMHSHITENGYNMTYGGEGGDTYTNNPRKDELRKSYSLNNKGKHRSEESKIKMRLAAKNRPPRSEETRRKASLSMMGKNTGDSNGARNPGVGQKISEALKNRKNKGEQL